MRTPDGFDLQGHRGARGLAPEDTLPAFRRALDLGVTTLEMDAVISADRQVVVSHDPWMASAFCSHPDGAPVRPEEEAGLLIYRMPYAEVARYDCGSRGHPAFPRQERQAAIKPLLRDVIRRAESHAAHRGRAPVFYNVETKSMPSGDGVLHPEPQAFVAREGPPEQDRERGECQGRGEPDAEALQRSLAELGHGSRLELDQDRGRARARAEARRRAVWIPR